MLSTSHVSDDPIENYFNIIFKSYFDSNPDQKIDKKTFADGTRFYPLMSFVALKSQD